MKIAIDASELEGRTTGVARYLNNLLNIWLDSHLEDRFLLLCDRDLPDHLSQHPNVEIVKTGTGPFGFDVFKQQFALKRALNQAAPDIFFAPAYTVPLLYRGTTVLAIHDISFEVHPEWFPRRHGMKMRWLTRRSARRASEVITGTHFIADQLQKTYDLDEHKIHTISHGIDASLLKRPFTSETQIRQKLGFDGPFVLMVGTLFERRFPIEIISAFRQLKDLGLHLVIVGDDRRLAQDDLEKTIDKMGLTEVVSWLRYCPEEDLLGLYREASQLIYLSAYEGFGLPPLEAMLFEIPVIVSARGALKEVYSKTAMMVENEDEASIAAMIRILATDKDQAAQCVDRGKRLVHELTIQSMAESTLEVIRSARNV